MTAGVRLNTARVFILLGISVALLLGAIGLLNSRGPGGQGGTIAGDQPPAASAGATAAPMSTDAIDPTDSPTDTPAAAPTPTARPAKAARPKSLPPDELTGYVWPLRNALITSGFRHRDFGTFVMIDGEEIHDGLDLATFCGDKVRAAHDGKVLYAGRNFDVFLGYRGKPEQIYARLEQQGRVNTLPIVIVVDDGNGYRSVYVHLSKAEVEAGDLVTAGQVIGTEGRTGFATGCHLHYGLIRMDGGWQEVVPRLARFGYPSHVRERINPLLVLPWDDEFAPQKLRDRVNGATPTPVPGATSSPGATPSSGATPSPGASSTASPAATPGASAGASPPASP